MKLIYRILLKLGLRRLKHEFDFEGRCESCGKNLNLILTRISSHSVHLKSVECPEHSGKTMILWPQRKDIIEDET